MLDSSLWADLIGKTFKYKGRGPDYYDCYGLVVEIYSRMGINIPNHVYDERQETQTKALQENQLIWRKCEIKPGCCLLFSRNGLPVHIGVAIDDDRFIHSTEDHGQVIISRLSRGYDKRLIGAYEYAV